MMRARCPHCATVFRAAPEQLRQRAGKVRCGNCHKVFNALDNLIEQAPPTKLAGAPSAGAEPMGSVPAATPAEDALLLGDAPAGQPQVAERAGAATGFDDVGDAGAPIDETGVADNASVAEEAASEAASGAESEAESKAESQAESQATPEAKPETTVAPPAHTDQESSAAVAPRETRDAPGYNKWAEGTLSAPSMHFDEPKGASWLAVVVAVLLTLTFAAQLTLHYRTDIAARWPDVRPWLEEVCVSLDCNVPYPRQAKLISLEASELQIDPARGNLLVLHMTLKNRADFAQDYPAIELTLTNVQDATVVRRILAPADYLPPALDGAKAFAAQSELAARLYIDGKDTGAVGYRLYAFYP